MSYLVADYAIARTEQFHITPATSAFPRKSEMFPNGNIDGK
ncbi:MAG: hypothetical protein AB1861_11455 [Cyanobacteriota bacterium]